MVFLKNITIYNYNKKYITDMEIWIFCLCITILFPLGLIYHRIVKIEEDFKQYNELKQVELMMKGMELGIYEEDNEDEEVQ